MADAEKSEESTSKNALINIAITDIVGFGKSAEVLGKCIEQGIGPFTKIGMSWLDDKRARRSLLSWKQAASAAGLKVSGAEVSIGERTDVRLTLEAIKQQDHREAVAFASVEELKAIPGATDSDQGKDIPPEWVDQFWQHAGGVSHELMQRLWGRVLARKAAGVENYSKRSLRELSLLSDDEIEQIVSLAPFMFRVESALDGTEEAGILHHVGAARGASFGPTTDEAIEQANRPIREVLGPRLVERLTHVGLMYSSGWETEQLVRPVEGAVSLTIGRMPFVIHGFPWPNQKPGGMTIVPLGGVERITRVGMELMSLVDADESQRYVQALTNALAIVGLRLERA